MPEKFEHKQSRISTPIFIYVICILGFLGTLSCFILSSTELAFMVGGWYINYLLVSSLLIWISLIGIWKMKRWGVLTYTTIVVVTQIVLYKYNVILMWNYVFLIIATTVTLSAWSYFKRMS